MFALTQLRTMAPRLGKDKSGYSSTELVYLSVSIVVVAAIGAAIFGDSVGDFFNGFRLTKDGITFG